MGRSGRVYGLTRNGGMRWASRSLRFVEDEEEPAVAVADKHATGMVIVAAATTRVVIRTVLSMETLG